MLVPHLHNVPETLGLVPSTEKQKSVKGVSRGWRGISVGKMYTALGEDGVHTTAPKPSGSKLPATQLSGQTPSSDLQEPSHSYAHTHKYT